MLLEQVLVNLLENATRYAGAEPSIAVYARSAEDSVLVQVEDNGPGIAEHEREKGVREVLSRPACLEERRRGRGSG